MEVAAGMNFRGPNSKEEGRKPGWKKAEDWVSVSLSCFLFYYLCDLFLSGLKEVKSASRGSGVHVRERGYRAGKHAEEKGDCGDGNPSW